MWDKNNKTHKDTDTHYGKMKKIMHTSTRQRESFTFLYKQRD